MPFAADNSLMIIGLVLVGVLAWLFCAFTLAAMARSVGQNYNLFMVIGLLTGPVGLAAGYIYFRVTGERYRRSRYGEGGKYDVPEIIRCPSCGQSVPRSYDYCQFCDAPLHAGRRR